MDFTTNVKGTSIGRKHKKRHTKINPKTIKKIQISMNTYCKYKWIKMIHQKCTDCFNGYKKKIHIYTHAAYNRPTSDLETHTDWEWEYGKIYSLQWKSKENSE